MPMSDERLNAFIEILCTVTDRHFVLLSASFVSLDICILHNDFIQIQTRLNTFRLLSSYSREKFTQKIPNLL